MLFNYKKKPLAAVCKGFTFIELMIVN
ncbi:MAG: prepilin-type N-terminal cleavage/methylation domain-containing protein [Vulcanimicrobiota bacterium]